MFIARLPLEKQETFLNLAYTMVYADGRLDEREQLIFAGYQIESEVDMSKVHKVDFEKELAKLDDCTKIEKQCVFMELYAIALIDESYPEEEKILVEAAKKHFDISDEKMSAMHDALKNFTDAYKKLYAVVTTE